MTVVLYAGVGVVLLLGHMTCAVLASGRRGRRADEIADAWYRKQAEARLLGLRDDEGAAAVREAEEILREALQAG